MGLLYGIPTIAVFVESEKANVENVKGMHISGQFACPNNSPNNPIGLNPAWNNCVMNLIPFEPVPEGSSPEIREANARKMTFTKNQALKDIAPDSGAYFNEVRIYLRNLCDTEADESNSATSTILTGNRPRSDKTMKDWLL